MKKKCIVLLSFVFAFLCVAHATVLHVGVGQPYANLESAALVVNPGDTIRVHEGVYAGGVYLENVQGEPDAWIVIEAVDGELVIFEGGGNAWQFTDAAYLVIKGFVFQEQTGNGVNFDDGGTYDTPAHHIHFINCTFRDINATGNNDLLKMSGVDFFEIRNCTFYNGSFGGSGLDMVGCHDGLITHNHFENQGSNAIQAKGGTARILIENNFFKHCGQRALNLGGSTGLQFFRPIDAPYEAAELKAYSNVFIGSVTPVAFVGSIDCEVINNTMYRPEKWALRILQETVDTTRFAPCGNNTFSNNILYLDDRVTTECNIGPNTDPGSFTMSNNLWLNIDEAFWSGPDLPVTDPNILIQVDPLFLDPENDNFDLHMTSPAIGRGLDVPQPLLDYRDLPFNMPRSIGAFEGDVLSSVEEQPTVDLPLIVFPNPAKDVVVIKVSEAVPTVNAIRMLNSFGQFISISGYAQLDDLSYQINLGHIMNGHYFIQVAYENGEFQTAVLSIIKS